MAVATPVLPDVRADFPLLGREDRGRSICYLDSASTSQKPVAVIEAIGDYYRGSNANVHRGAYRLAEEATDLYEGARERVARFCGWDAGTTIFTKNVTEAINLVAYAWGRSNVGPGDEVLITTRTSCPGSCSARSAAHGSATSRSPTTASSRWMSSIRCSPRET
jgi:selenocysteine lyase/cysteine desulfurase